MRLAIMQPYILPYIGYFQLINAVDKFVDNQCKQQDSFILTKQRGRSDHFLHLSITYCL